MRPQRRGPRPGRERFVHESAHEIQILDRPLRKLAAVIGAVFVDFHPQRASMCDEHRHEVAEAGVQALGVQRGDHFVIALGQMLGRELGDAPPIHEDFITPSESSRPRATNRSPMRRLSWSEMVPGVTPSRRASSPAAVGRTGSRCSRMPARWGLSRIRARGSWTARRRQAASTRGTALTTRRAAREGSAATGPKLAKIVWFVKSN